MAECKSCGKEIPEGTLYCSECEARMKADESYLDSLLSSVVSNSVEPIQERPAKKTTAEPLQERQVKKTDTVSLEEQLPVSENLAGEELFTKAEYSIFGDSDDSFLDDLFEDDANEDNAFEEESRAWQEAELLEELLKTVDNAENEYDMADIYEDSAAYEASEPESVAPQDELIAENPSTSLFDIYDDELDAEATLLGEALAREVLSPEEEIEESHEVEPFSQITEDDPFSMLGISGTQQETTDTSEAVSDDMSDFWNIINEAETETVVTGDGLGAYDSLPELLGEEESLEAIADIPVVEEQAKEVPKKKKKGLFTRIFGNVREELTEEEIEERKRVALEKFEEDEQRAADEAAQEKLDKEAREKRKEEEAAQKKAEKELLARKKADEKLIKAEQKRIQKDKKEQAKRALLAEIEENEGKINKFGASIIIAMFAAMLCLITIGTSYYNYKISIDKAQFDFDLQRYDDAYNDVYGLDIKEEDMELYDKIMTVQYVNVQLLSYMRYHSLDMDAEALDSLIKGLRRYEKFIQHGTELGVKDDLNYLKTQIVEQLDSVFRIDEATAYEMLALESQEDYSVQIYGIVSKKN